jgi:hypothetical protein
MKTLTIPAAVAALLCAQGAQGFDLKGVEVGVTLTDAALKRARSLGCGVSQPCGDRMPEGTKDVLPFITAHRVETVLVFITPESFGAFDKMMRAKYGNPTQVENSVLQNGFGARFFQTVETWRNGAGDMAELSRYYSHSTDTGGLTLMSAAALAKETAKSAAHSGL